ncbi:MAG: IS630 family transposase [Parachlamydiaceae bacterium]
MDIWFQDEARVGQRGTLKRTWAKKGARRRLTRQQQFEYAYVFGAVCPRTNQSVGLVLPAANSHAMVIHLEEISKNIPKDRDGVVVLDGAAWHKAKKIQGFNNLSVLVLLPASPELNPVEQIWQQLRDNWLANRCYDGYERILDACCHAWNWFVDLPGKINRLCSRSWAEL